jgi:hypothetical protein
MKPKVSIGGIKSTSCVFFKVDNKSAAGPVFGTEIKGWARLGPVRLVCIMLNVKIGLIK